jgi:hypothetical protein
MAGLPLDMSNEPEATVVSEFLRMIQTRSHSPSLLLVKPNGVRRSAILREWEQTRQQLGIVAKWPAILHNGQKCGNILALV